MHCLVFKPNFPILFIIWFLFAMLFWLVSMKCVLLVGEFIPLFTFIIKLHYLVHFVVCLAMLFLLVSIQCRFLASEFTVHVSFTFKVKPLRLVHNMVYLCHVVLLISIHCELLGGEFNAFFIFKSNLPVFYILRFVFATLLLLVSM